MTYSIKVVLKWLSKYCQICSAAAILWFILSKVPLYKAGTAGLIAERGLSLLVICTCCHSQRALFVVSTAKELCNGWRSSYRTSNPPFSCSWRSKKPFFNPCLLFMIGLYHISTCKSLSKIQKGFGGASFLQWIDARNWISIWRFCRCMDWENSDKRMVR